MVNMKNLAIRLVLYCVIALVPISCGTRKAATKILKNAEIVKEEAKSEGVVKKVDTVKDQVKEVVKSRDIVEDKTIVVTELYNDSGVIKSRVISTVIGRKSNNISNTKIISNEVVKSVDSSYNNSSKKSSEVTSYSKEKAVTSDRNGWYYVMGIVAVIAMALWLKPWAR